MTPYLKGGQGRASGDVQDDGMILLAWMVVGVVAMILAGVCA